MSDTKWIEQQKEQLMKDYAVIPKAIREFDDE